MQNCGPLSGVRIVEMGQLIAGPFAGHMLAYFGAEVIKIETPGKGDPLRAWRLVENGTSYWWRSLARNKQSVTLNLNTEKGRDIARQLILKSDVLIENFRPGKMESWGLGPDDLADVKPDLVYTRVSGYGQTGPYRNKPGFASACEAMGGFRHLNGFADRPPVRPNLSMGDTLAGMHAVIGTLMALFHRQNQPDGKG
ncbi:MAG: CoA transferase, partial [Granulosicoccus sp.]|nr:CoA transferase [Granulosicoccus sp.]